MADTLITIRNVEQAEPEMLLDVLSHLGNYIDANTIAIEVNVNARVPDDAPEYKHPGWCEYLCHIRYVTQRRLTIGAIQRKRGAQTEFHS